MLLSHVPPIPNGAAGFMNLTHRTGKFHFVYVIVQRLLAVGRTPFLLFPRHTAELDFPASLAGWCGSAT